MNTTQSYESDRIELDEIHQEIDYIKTKHKYYEQYQ